MLANCRTTPRVPLSVRGCGRTWWARRRLPLHIPLTDFSRVCSFARWVDGRQHDTGNPLWRVQKVFVALLTNIDRLASADHAPFTVMSPVKPRKTSATWSNNHCWNRVSPRHVPWDCTSSCCSVCALVCYAAENSTCPVTNNISDV